MDLFQTRWPSRYTFLQQLSGTVHHRNQGRRQPDGNIATVSRTFSILELWVVANIAPPVLNVDRPVRRAKVMRKI